MGKVKAGICPKCKSQNTWVEFHRMRGENLGKVRAKAVCGDCGFEDTQLRGDDEQMVIEIAKKSFLTVYLDEKGAEADGLPSVDELAADISALIRIICRDHPDCCECPIHQPDKEPGSLFSEGGFFVATKMAISCRDQDLESCMSRLVKKYPNIPVKF